jgi:mRNA interferase RelE/StbE
LGYKVVLSPGAAKEFRKLDKVVQKPIASLIDEIEAAANPRIDVKALKGNAREWRYKVGDYRMVCEIKDRELIVWIIRVRRGVLQSYSPPCETRQLNSSGCRSPVLCKQTAICSIIEILARPLNQTYLRCGDTG